MATLKTISVRLKSIKNIQKITKSMKMVSAAKYTKAERELRIARPIGEGSRQFYEKAEVAASLSPDEKTVQTHDSKEAEKLYIAVTSDKGLCGAVHSSVCKLIKKALVDAEKFKIVCVGDKSRNILQREFGKNILFVCTEVGRTPPTFLEASQIASRIISSGYEFSSGTIAYNRFVSAMSYETAQLPLFQLDSLLAAPKVWTYEDVDDETLKCFNEFNMAAMLYYAMKQAACSELSARMAAMENSSKNAGDLIGKLTVVFNRTRQAAITNELVEIISGAAALQKQ